MSRRTAGLACTAAFLLAAALRFLNSTTAFIDGIPQIRPFDDLYHLKRMTHSAARFPGVLELDRDRGIDGAFCPWPPLYDLAAGGVARLFGATAIGDVLSIVVWIPPLVFAAFVALLVAIIGRRAPIASAAAGVALAASPCLVFASWIGSIDHHFLEPLLVSAIVGGVLLVLRSDETASRSLRAGMALGVAMTVAMFVQIALVAACGIAFLICFTRRRFASTAVAFSIPALAIALYRSTRMDGFPESAWFLGWPYAALFFGGAVAALAGWRSRATTLPRMAASLAAGAVTTLAVPGAAHAIAGGILFFGGNPWLGHIEEFQPIVGLSGGVSRSFLYCLSSGALLVWLLLARALRRRDPSTAAVALFAIAYLALALSSRRFTIIAAPLLAVAGSLLAEAWYRDGRRIAGIVAALLVAVPPVVHLVATPRPDPLGPLAAPLQTVGFLRDHNPNRERVLSQWSWGHALDVLTGSPVIIDNFGDMPSPATFKRACETLLTADENELARYCEEAGARYVVLASPATGLPETALAIGRPIDTYIRNGAPTAAMRATWWWRAWEAVPRPTRFFRPVFANKDGTVVVWRFAGLRRSSESRRAITPGSPPGSPPP